MEPKLTIQEKLSVVFCASSSVALGAVPGLQLRPGSPGVSSMANLCSQGTHPATWWKRDNGTFQHRRTSASKAVKFRMLQRARQGQVTQGLHGGLFEKVHQQIGRQLLYLTSYSGLVLTRPRTGEGRVRGEKTLPSFRRESVQGRMGASLLTGESASRNGACPAGLFWALCVLELACPQTSPAPPTFLCWSVC